jgi:hypothetical protein
MEAEDRRMCGPFTVDRIALVTPAEMVPPRGWVVALWLDAEPVAGGSVRTLADGVGTVKRMWVAPELARAGCRPRSKRLHSTLASCGFGWTPLGTGGG